MTSGLWELRRDRTVVSILLVVVGLAGGWWWQQSRTTAPTAHTSVGDPLLSGEPLDPPPASPTASQVGVDIVGAVQRPGVYFLPAGSRVLDAVQAAGGLAPNANRDAINLSAHVADAEQLRVPRVGEAAATTGGTAASVATSGKLDINTADAAALATLNGIGPALAQRIIAYRTANGPFATIDDLQNVKGISAKLFAQVRDQVRVGGS